MTTPDTSDEGGVSPSSGHAPPAEHRFQPGRSGNPKGRPPTVSITALLKKRLAGSTLTSYHPETGRQLVKPLPDGVSVADLVVAAILDEAIGTRRVGVLRELMDRVDGKVPVKVQATGFVLSDVVAEAEAVALAFIPAERPKGK